MLNFSLCIEFLRVYLLPCVFVAKNVCFTKKVFLSFNHKKPIKMCHKLQFYLSLAGNTHFLVFNTAKQSHCLIAMQKLLLMSATQNTSGQTKLYKNLNFKNTINFLNVSWGIKWCGFSVLTE